ncbi:MAG: glycosyltransferase, partial [Gemmatimonadetes bacterium]|nr:glycosyltransferase [Gemmatimonadota bacterium]
DSRARLTLVGGRAGDEYWGAVRYLIVELGLGDAVTMVDQASMAHLAAIYRTSDVFVLLSEHEGFCVPLLEAMHFGVPLVTSDLDFARDVCGGAAVYADPLDAPALARAVARAVRDDGLRRRLREAGFHRVRGFPGWPERTDAYVEACVAAASSASFGSDQVRVSAR